jgi:hypothetical protein
VTLAPYTSIVLIKDYFIILATSHEFIKGYAIDENIIIDWKVATESDDEKYILEWSRNGQAFVDKPITEIKTIQSGLNTHRWIDSKPEQGTNYYRIRAVKESGTFKYSPILKVQLTKEHKTINIYPNPMTGETLKVNVMNLARGKYSLKLINSVGQTIHSRQIEHSGGSIAESFHLDNRYMPGNYQVSLEGSGFKISKHVIKL